jgi:predicted Zn finger-like uncharacterized protein
MSEFLEATCPHCDARFQVAREQLEQAEGQVRCGNCLQVFDGISGEMNFTAPRLIDEELSHPVAGLGVKPMALADLPAPRQRTSWSALLVLAGLLGVLATQLYLPYQSRQAVTPGVELGRIVVRPHPDVDGALRLDAVLHNRSQDAAPYPLLMLAFTNRQGEPRAKRTFLPAEYLHGTTPLRIPARSEIQISLALADPGRDAVNFLARLVDTESVVD